MDNIKQIDSFEALSEFLNAVKGLHDALLHEALLLHPGYVDHDRKMHNDAALPSAKLIFQSQARDFAAVQIDLNQVAMFRLDFERELELDAAFENGRLILYPNGKALAQASEIHAASGQYKILDKEFLGKEYKLTRGS